MSENKVTDPTTGEQVEVIDIQLYALNLSDDGRVLSAAEDQYGADGQPRVATLPEGDLYDYKYVDSEFIYDPLPKSEPSVEEPSVEEDTLSMLVDHEERIIMMELGLTE